MLFLTYLLQKLPIFKKKTESKRSRFETKKNSFTVRGSYWLSSIFLYF